MASRAAARINIIADATGVRRGTREAERDISRLSRAGSASLSVLKTSALAAGAAVGTTLAVGVKTGWQELQEAEAASARLNTVLTATKGAAGLTRGELDRMNETLQRNSTLEGDVIQGAQAMLLTFTNIGEKTFPRATQAAIDWARVQKIDVEAAAKLVGRALQDPEKGLARLERAGLSFTEAEKKRIVAMKDAGREQEAQALILQKLEGRVKGAERAYSQTLPGAIDRGKRAFKDFSEDAVRTAIEEWPKIQRVIGKVVDWIRENVVPEVRAAVRAMTRFYEEHREDIQDVVRLIGRTLERVVTVVKNVARFVRAVIQGDWGDAWNAAKTAVGTVIDGIVDFVRTLGPKLLRWGRNAAGDLARGLVEGVDAALRRMPGGGALRRILGFDNTDYSADITRVGRERTGTGNRFSNAGRAAGGFIPGQYRGVDDQVALLASGEAVLTPTQQSMVPGGRATLARIFALTGGVFGGASFQTGGVVAAARQRAEGNLGEPYGKPSRGESRTGPNSWDCSGYATMIAGVNVGGTTASAYQQSIGVRDHTGYPIVWGFRKSHGGTYRGGYDEHMGVRVGGVWYQTSGGRTARTGSDGSWQEIRVPRGLERLRGTSSDGDGSEATVDNSRPAPARKLKPALLTSLRGGGRAPGLTASDRISGRDSDDSLQERRAGNVAEAGARAQGITNPEKLSAIREKAANVEQIRDLRADRRDLLQELRSVRRRWAELWKKRGQAFRRLRAARTQAAQNREIAEIRAVNEQLSECKQQERALIREITDVDNRLALLGDDQVNLDTTIAGLSDAPAATTTADTASGSLTPDQERAIRQGQVAENENVSLREFLGVAFGPGDIGTGGGTAIGAATGGRWVPLRVDASSFLAAMGSSVTTGGYVTAGIVPSGA